MFSVNVHTSMLLFECVHEYMSTFIMAAQVTKLKAQLEKMDRELGRWRAGESVSTDEQVAIDMEASTTSQQLSKSCIVFTEK